MSELSPASRALLDAARDGMGPNPDAIARMRAGIDASVATGATGGAAAAKLGVFAVVAALVIGAGVYGTRANHPSTPVTPRLELPVAVTETSPPEITPSTSQIEDAPAAAAAAAARPAHVATPPADLAREVVLLDQAMAALRTGDAVAALAAIRTHGVETRGHGQLAEDAAAIEIEAMCLLHDPRVAARLDAFDERFPRSAQRSRLTSSCP